MCVCVRACVHVWPSQSHGQLPLASALEPFCRFPFGGQVWAWTPDKDLDSPTRRSCILMRLMAGTGDCKLDFIDL